MNEQPEALRLTIEPGAVIPVDIETTAMLADELRRLHAENEALQKALRRVVRTYMVADDAWDRDAELERLYQREMKT